MKSGKPGIVNWEDAERLFLNGSSYAAIADKYGVSRQWVSLHFQRLAAKQTKELPIPYVGIREWMAQHDMGYADMARSAMDDEKLDVSKRNAFRKLLNGETERWSIDTINRVLKTTGLTFEEAFRKEGA